jgi:hypothetical protein
MIKNPNQRIHRKEQAAEIHSTFYYSTYLKIHRRKFPKAKEKYGHPSAGVI